MTACHLFTYCRKRYLILSLPVVFVLGGCATEPVSTPSLVEAQSAYAKIRTDSRIAANDCHLGIVVA